MHTNNIQRVSQNNQHGMEIENIKRYREMGEGDGCSPAYLTTTTTGINNVTVKRGS